MSDPISKLTTSVNRLNSNIEKIIEKLGIPVQGVTLDTDTIPDNEEMIILAPGNPIPWLVEAQKWEGKSEVFDQVELTEFLGVNPNDQDGGQPWCADFINACMKRCGIEGTGSSAAISFSDWGTECGCVDGAIAAYGPANIPGGHVGIVLGDGLFGGNQGDSARLNLNRAWFDQNKKLIGYRSPPGYVLNA